MSEGPPIAGVSYWMGCVLVWLLAWAAVELLVAKAPRSGVAGRACALAIPLVFGATLLFWWEMAVRGLHLPGVILPPPSAIAARILTSPGILAADLLQTGKGLAVGYLVGSTSGCLWRS